MSRSRCLVGQRRSSRSSKSVHKLGKRFRPFLCELEHRLQRKPRINPSYTVAVTAVENSFRRNTTTKVNMAHPSPTKTMSNKFATDRRTRMTQPKQHRTNRLLETLFLVSSCQSLRSLKESDTITGRHLLL